MDKRITRIKEMETHLNRLIAWLKDGTGDVSEDARILDEYYHSPLWRSDFEADEAGELPADLPRGVLSEDAIYNALEEYREQCPTLSPLTWRRRIAILIGSAPLEYL